MHVPARLCLLPGTTTGRPAGRRRPAPRPQPPQEGARNSQGRASIASRRAAVVASR